MRKIPFIFISILLWANVSIGQQFPTIVSDGNGDPYMLLNGSRTLAFPWWAAYDAGFSNAVVAVSPIAVGGGVTSLVQTNSTSAIGGTTLFNNTNFLTPAAALLTYQPLLGFTPQGGSMNLTNWGNLGTNQLNLYLLTSDYDASWGGLPTNIFSLYTPTANLGALAFDSTVNSNFLTGHWNFGQIDGVPTLFQSDSNHWTGLLNLSQLAGGTIPAGVSVPASQLTGTLPAASLPGNVITNGGGVIWITNNSPLGIVVTNINSLTGVGYGTPFTLETNGAFSSSSIKTRNASGFLNMASQVQFNGGPNAIEIGTSTFLNSSSSGQLKIQSAGDSTGITIGTANSGSAIYLSTNTFIGGTVTATNGFVEPSNSIPVAVTVGASPFLFTNLTTANLKCRIGDGTTITTSVGINGVTVYASTTDLNVREDIGPNEVLTLTYSGGTPTLFTNK